MTGMANAAHTAHMANTAHSVRRRNMRKSQSDVEMRLNEDADLIFYDGHFGFRETASPRLKRQFSERTAECYDEERRKRNKENHLEQVARVNRTQAECWLRVRNHMVRCLTNYKWLYDTSRCLKPRS